MASSSVSAANRRCVCQDLRRNALVLPHLVHLVPAARRRRSAAHLVLPLVLPLAAVHLLALPLVLALPLALLVHLLVLALLVHLLVLAHVNHHPHQVKKVATTTSSRAVTAVLAPAVHHLALAPAVHHLAPALAPAVHHLAPALALAHLVLVPL